MGWAFDCAGTRSVIVKSINIKFFPGKLYLAITYAPIEKNNNDTNVETEQITKELIAYLKKLYLWDTLNFS